LLTLFRQGFAACSPGTIARLARAHLRAPVYNGTPKIPLLVFLISIEKYPDGAVLSRHKEAHMVEISFAATFHHPITVL
jgi:hypothetical protein